MFVAQDKDKENILWMEETVEDVPSNRILYKILCFFLGKRKKKLTYKDLYLFYTNTYNLKNKDIVSIKEKTMETLIDIYYYNKGYYPEIK